MKDYVHKLTKWIDYNRGTFVAFLAIIVVAVGTFVITGCASKAIGLMPGVEVTRQELSVQVIEREADYTGREAVITAEVAALNADKLAVQKKVDVAIKALDRQDEFKASIAEFVGIAATDLMAGTLNPYSLILPALGISGLIYGGGKKFDNVRKDKVITENGKKT